MALTRQGTRLPSGRLSEMSYAPASPFARRATFSLKTRVFSSSVKSKMGRPRTWSRGRPRIWHMASLTSMVRASLSMSQKPSLEVSRIRRILRSLAASACSLRFRSVMSVKLITAPRISPSFRIGVAPYSTGSPLPSLHHRYSSSMRLARPWV